MYPVHYSVPPMFMREFLDEYQEAFAGKEIISAVSQMFYSGDGARTVEDFLPDTCKLIDAWHINMPNNIPNIPGVPIAPKGGIKRKVKRALRKTDKMAAAIKNEDFAKRHCSRFAVKIGESQRPAGMRSEQSKRSKVWVSDECISCGLCVRICPTRNFTMQKKAVPQGRCTLCLRCENRCPAKAITVLFERPVKRAYPGPEPK